MLKGPWCNPIVMTIFKGTVVKNYDGAMAKVTRSQQLTPFALSWRESCLLLRQRNWV
jgi:hypothetical protein